MNMVKQNCLIIILYLSLILTVLACQQKGSKVHITQNNLARPRVLVLSPERYIYGDGTSVDKLIEDTGALNAADHLTGEQQVNDSQIIEMNPDIIIFTSRWQNTAIIEWANASVYAEINAIRTKQLYRFPYRLTDANLQVKSEQYRILLKQLLWRQN